MTIIYTDNTLDLTNLKRKPEVEKDYQAYLKIIKNAGSTPEEVILNKLEGKELAILTSDFPYDLPEMEHKLVWSTQPNNTYIFETPAMFYITLDKTTLYVSKVNVVAFFENGEKEKSVKLKHYHLIVRK